MNEVQEMTQAPEMVDVPEITEQYPCLDPMIDNFGYPEPLPEAGGVAWIDLYGQRIITSEDGKQYRKVFKISLTARATSPIQALDKLKEAIDHAESKYSLRPYTL